MRMLVLAGLAVVAIWLPAARDGASLANDYPFVERVTVSSAGEEANDHSFSPAISADGRFVAFVSSASNLADPDANERSDVFVRDRLMGVTERVSVASDGTEANGDSWDPAMSSDGRFVVFPSGADNLVLGAEGSLFIRDRVLGTTEALDVPRGIWPGVSDDGRYVVFTTDTPSPNYDVDVFLHDRQHGWVRRISHDESTGVLGARSYLVSMSGDGQLVALDVVTETGEGVAIYSTQAEGITTLIRDLDGDLAGSSPSLSRDGQFATFIGFHPVVEDDPPGLDVFVLDLTDDSLRRASVGFSPDEAATYVKPVPAPISDEGKIVAFVASESPFTSGDPHNRTDLFAHDLGTGITAKLTIGDQITQGVSDLFRPLAISRDGRFVAVESKDSMIVEEDTNGVTDIFVYDVSKLDEVAEIASPVLTPTPTSPPPIESAAPTPGVLPPTGGRVDRNLWSTAIGVAGFLLLVAVLAMASARRLGRPGDR